MVYHQKLLCLVKRWDCSVVVKVKVTGKVKISSHPDDVSSAKSFVTKLGGGIDHSGPERHAGRLVCYLLGQDRQWGLIRIRYDCFYCIYCTDDVLATKFNRIVHHHTLECRVYKLDRCKNWMVVFKVTAKVQNFIESLCVSYLLYHWSLGDQTRCADLLLLITERSSRKWAFTDRNILGWNITFGLQYH